MSQLPPPRPNQAYFEVSAISGGFLTFPTHLFVSDVPETEVVHDCPSIVFLLRHSQSKELIVFDLGILQAFERQPPGIQARAKIFAPLRVPRTVEQQLRESDVDPCTVSTVILSHLHWDHTGDHTPFTNATFILGSGSAQVLENAYPKDPNSLFTASCVPADRTRFLAESDYTTSIGPFPRAHDLLGDGSIYIIDAFGHMAGHINVLARTSPAGDGSWVYLAGDSAHDRRLVTGEKEIRVRYDEDGHRHCNHVDKSASEENLRRIAMLLKEGEGKVEVILAHDKEWFEKNQSALFPGIIQAKV